MARRIRWVGVIAGAALTSLLLLLLIAFVKWVMFPYVEGTTTEFIPGIGHTFTSAKQWELYQTLTKLSFLSALLLSLVAFFVGALVVGMVAPSSPELNGVLASIIVVTAALAWLLSSTVPEILTSSVESYTFGDNAAFLGRWGVVLWVVSPFAMVAGYFGAQLGRRLRSRAAPRSAS